MDTLSAVRSGRGGDPGAWEVLHRKVREVVFDKLDRKDLPAGCDAEDLLAIVLAEIFRSLHAFDPDAAGASFRGWVYTVRQRKLIDLWREARAGRRGGGKVRPLESILTTATETVDFVDDKWVSQSGLFRCKDLQERIAESLRGLDQKDLDVLRMREESCLDFQRIAELLGYDKAVTARSRYFRARERRAELLRPLFAGYEVP
jgi:RNA polymerase sigma factor (sigma-70 family)